jgi:hypothetical protein
VLAVNDVNSTAAVQVFAAAVPKKGTHYFAVHLLAISSIHSPAINFWYVPAL